MSEGRTCPAGKLSDRGDAENFALQLPGHHLVPMRRPRSRRLAIRDRPLLDLHRSQFLKPFETDRRAVVTPLFDLGYRAVLCADHNAIDRNRFLVVEQTDPAIDRERTDFFLFY